uniref:CSON012165 protein n=1 Tax=Culicoides sonorensis TaxID=179676 RepID=A0A336KLV2_CULSO
MASNLDQFPELELSKEDREQIFEYIDPPVAVGETQRTQNGARCVCSLCACAIHLITKRL